MTERRRECEWCTRLASAVVHAQWSLFDWDDAEVCEDHRAAATTRFWNRRVDGKQPVDVWATPIYWAQRMNFGL